MSATHSGRLDVRGVSFRAGGVQILSGIGMELHAGELCGLIGPSGAGKSTLIKVMLGVREPDAGTVRAGGKPLGELGPIGYVPQDDAVHRQLTVHSELDYAARLRLPDLPAAEHARRIAEVCAQVDLADRVDTRIGRLSGGQRKRVSVALELLTRPPVLIADEPTSGLDPGLEARLTELFRDVARSGRIVLVATHAMQSLELCDALGVLIAGHLAFFGPPAEALSFFRAEDFGDIFEQLPKMAPAAWARRYAGSPLRASFAARPAPTLGAST